MIEVTFSLKSLAPYSPSRRTDSDFPKEVKEKPADYEERTWREKAHWNAKGQFYIPSIQFLKALQSTASYLSEKIPGKGQSTWSKNFRAGITCFSEEGIVCPEYTRKNVPEIRVHCDAQGMKGGKGGSQVVRVFPQIPSWAGELSLVIIDSTISPELLERYLKECGLLNGVGRWRPQNGGLNGRFEVVGMSLKKARN